MLRPDLTSFETSAQNEALINEFKGNLFEYLVASVMARHYKVESNFVRSFSGKLREQFAYYESWLRKHDLDLVKKLPILAQSTFSAIEGSLPGQVDDIFVVGKLASGSGNKSLDEADIAYVIDNKLYPISLKLCKANAFVNTKSGGIRTFISKYFGIFNDSEKLQSDLNSIVDVSFSRVGHKMYEIAGLEWEGRFDQQWADTGLSELPGQLPKEHALVLQSFYHESIHELYHSLKLLFESDKELFKSSLLPLVGFGREDIMQVTCFHRDRRVEGRVEKYMLDSVEFYTSEHFYNVDIVFGDLKEKISSFEILFGNTVLQIRVKPMNKFTAPALKVNCSVKNRGEK